nr:MAG TPA: hypothetical protein [Caudoviricetes sp.]DAR26992.1 MAG TPA: hypothetical protein [Caudoviricetes sp.]
MRKRVSEAYRLRDASDGVFDENFNTSKQCVKKS